jgi:hypothetical protein
VVVQWSIEVRSLGDTLGWLRPVVPQEILSAPQNTIEFPFGYASLPGSFLLEGLLIGARASPNRLNGPAPLGSRTTVHVGCNDWFDFTATLMRLARLLARYCRYQMYRQIVCAR